MCALLGIQLYTVREAAEKDYLGTMRKLAMMGYQSVEPGDFTGTTIDEAVKIYNDLNLKVTSCHLKLPVGDNKNQVLDTAQKLGSKYIFTGVSISRDWDSADKIKQYADIYNEAAENAAAENIKIGTHNHAWEMQTVDGKPAYRIFLENTSPDVIWEIDTYWVKVGGLDPVEVVKEMGVRCPIIHVKDGMCERGAPFKPLGEGLMDIPPILKVASDKEIFIVEQDSGEGDMLVNAETSINYLKKIIKAI